MLKQLLIRHFASAGFQKRLRYIYIPLLKKGGAYVWNLYADRKERKVFEQIYKTTQVVVDHGKQEPTASAPTGASIPLYENIASRLKVWFVDSPYQGSTGQCVAFTLDNIIRAVAKLLGYGNIAVSPLDVYLDRTTRISRGDFTGMNVALMFQSVAKKGVAVGELLPRMDDQSLMYQVDTRELYPDDIIAPFRLKLIEKADFVGTDWRNLMNTINSLPMGFPVQISISVGDGYFGYDIPKPLNGTVYGGHSVCAIGGSGCIVDGKEGFFITDSAFFKGRVSRWGQTIRFINKDFWVRNGMGCMLPKFIEPIQTKALENKPKVHIEMLVTPAQKGEEGDHVRAMQNALISLGYNIPSGATGFYGVETAKVVLAFQLANLARLQKLDPSYTKTKLEGYAGAYFGRLSVEVINTLIEEL